MEILFLHSSSPISTSFLCSQSFFHFFHSLRDVASKKFGALDLGPPLIFGVFLGFCNRNAFNSGWFDSRKPPLNVAMLLSTPIPQYCPLPPIHLHIAFFSVPYQCLYHPVMQLLQRRGPARYNVRCIRCKVFSLQDLKKFVFTFRTLLQKKMSTIKCKRYSLDNRKSVPKQS